MAEGNYLKYSVSATFGLIVCLGLMYLVPEFDLGSFHFKRVNLLADILKKDPTATHLANSDTTVYVRPAYVDTCRTGITCVEDFSPDSAGMQAYLSALDSVSRQVVRIAYFADSYVEGDIMLETFRDSMQCIYGGGGVGFVPITSEVAGFRQTIIHTFSHWDTYSIVGERNDDHPLGPAGMSFASHPGSEVSYKAPSHRHLSSFPTAKLFYKKCTDCALIRNEADTLALTGADDNINILDLGRNQQSLKLSISSRESVDLYGVSFEDSRGISVDNFSIRGNSGMGLNYVTEDMYRQFDAIHPYRLIVLSYGLNVANEKSINYKGYGKNMTKVVQRMKKAFPHSTILVVGCSDRAAKIDGEYKTMPSIKELINVQRQVAADNGVCFWNLFDAMGGDSTMIRWVDAKPPLANKDYTHLTFRGGRKVANILIGTLLYEKEKYDRKKKIAVHQLLSSR